MLIKRDEDFRFRWWHTFIGALAAALIALVTVAGDGSALESAAKLGVLVCAIAVLALLVGERRHEIQTWFSRRDLRFLIGGPVAAFFVGLVVGSLVLPGDDARSAVGSASYAAHVSQLLLDLDAQRTSAYRRLGEVQPKKERGKIATVLGATFDTAAATLRRLQAQPIDRDAGNRVAIQLEAVGDAYRKMGKAVVDPDGSQKALDRTRRRVRSATRRLWAAEEALAGRRYRIVRPAVLGLR